MNTPTSGMTFKLWKNKTMQVQLPASTRQPMQQSNHASGSFPHKESFLQTNIISHALISHYYNNDRNDWFLGVTHDFWYNRSLSKFPSTAHSDCKCQWNSLIRQGMWHYLPFLIISHSTCFILVFKLLFVSQITTDLQCVVFLFADLSYGRCFHQGDYLACY